MLEKHPQWKKVYNSYLKHDTDILIDDINRVFTKIIKFKHITHKVITPKLALSLFNCVDEKSILERLDDCIEAILIEHQVNQFITSLKSKKYEHLFNDETESLIEGAIRSGISTPLFKNAFFNKIATYSNCSDLNRDLRHFIKQNQTWSEENTLGIIKSLQQKFNIFKPISWFSSNEVKILHSKDNILLIEVKNFNEAKALGAKSWCITKEKTYFSYYTQNNARQYILFNFNLPNSDIKSLIGITINEYYEIKTIHARDDSVLGFHDIKHLDLPLNQASDYEKSKMLLFNNKKALCLSYATDNLELFKRSKQDFTSNDIISAFEYESNNIIQSEDFWDSIFLYPNSNRYQQTLYHLSIEYNNQEFFLKMIKSDSFFENDDFVKLLDVAIRARCSFAIDAILEKIEIYRETDKIEVYKNILLSGNVVNFHNYVLKNKKLFPKTKSEIEIYSNILFLIETPHTDFHDNAELKEFYEEQKKSGDDWISCINTLRHKYNFNVKLNNLP